MHVCVCLLGVNFVFRLSYDYKVQDLIVGDFKRKSQFYVHFCFNIFEIKVQALFPKHLSITTTVSKQGDLLYL